jgi:hypothetical protein
LTFLGDVAGACTNIQQVVVEKEKEEEEKEEEGDTPHVGTWRNVREWVHFFGGLH